MADKKEKNFYVTDGANGWNFFESLEDAQARARREAWRDAEDVFIYQKIAVAEKPVDINTVNVKTL